jgi:hypothetical protein
MATTLEIPIEVVKFAHALNASAHMRITVCGAFCSTDSTKNPDRQRRSLEKTNVFSDIVKMRKWEMERVKGIEPSS